MRDGLGRAQHVLLLGGSSEIGLAAVRAMRLPEGSRVVLAGRDKAALEAAASGFRPGVETSVEVFDALEPQSAVEVVDRAFAHSDVDVVIPAFGLLGDQAAFESNPGSAAELFTVNATTQVVVLLAVAAQLRRQGHGTVVALSSVAAVRPRRANFVYGASKSALDAAATGLADALVGSGARVLIVRPGFVIGRMTAGMRPAPLSTTPEVVGRAVADALRDRRSVVWVPSRLRVLATAMRLVPRPMWRRLRR
jgi:decaprenylphospho-beta-D-erythro-pentofuranosid-2-ulose 2-reductase